MAGLLTNIGSKLLSGTKSIGGAVGGAVKDVAKDELYGSLGNFGSALRKRVEGRPPEEKKDELSDLKKDVNQQNENIAATEKATNDAKKDAQKYQTNYVFKSIDYKLDNIQLSQKYILHDVNRLLFLSAENKKNQTDIQQPTSPVQTKSDKKSNIFDTLTELGGELLGTVALPVIGAGAIGAGAGYIFGNAVNKILSPIRKGLGYTAENYPGMAKWGREHSFWNGQTQQTTQSEKVLTEQEKQKQRNNILINAGDYKIDSSRNVSIVSLGSMLFESKSSDTIRFKSPHIVFEGNRIDFIETSNGEKVDTKTDATSAGPQGAVFDPSISAPAFGGTQETKGAYTGFTAPMDATSIATDNQNARKFTGSAEAGSGSGIVESNEFYKAIIDAEGTAKHGNPYDTSLGYMKSPKPLSQMTMDEAFAWGEQVKKAQGLNSSAKGAFQILNTTQKDAMAALGLKGSDLFNEVNQKKMASWIAHNQGLGAWEGFKKHPDQLKIAQQALQGGKDKDFTTTSQSSSNIKVEKTKPVESTSDAVKDNLSPTSSAPSLTPSTFGTDIKPVPVKTESVTPSIASSGSNENQNTSTNKSSSGGMVTLKTQSGKSYQVASEYADKFQSFVNDLESTGYKINSIGGYANRNIAGTNTKSWHAKGMAIDINPSDNPVTYRGQPGAGKTNLPPNISDIAARHGLGWGGNWKHKLDTMHFSFGPNEGGTGKEDRNISSEESHNHKKNEPSSTQGGTPQSISPQSSITPSMSSPPSGGGSDVSPSSMAGNMLGGMIPGGMGGMLAPMIGSALESMSADMKFGNLGNMMGIPGAQLNNMSQNDIMNQRTAFQPHVENHKLAQLSQPATRTNVAPNYSQKSSGFIATPTDEEHYFGATGFMRPVTEHSKAYASASGHRSAGAFLT